VHTLGDIAKALNRSPLYLRGLQARFELPIRNGAGYSPAYLALLRTIVILRTLNVSEEVLRELWCLEKKIIQLLNANFGESGTWFLDHCDKHTHLRRRLLLTRFDLGVELPMRTLQPGLNFSHTLPELFAGSAMGEDVLRILDEYLGVYSRVRAQVVAEIPLVNAAHHRATWLSNAYE
jgi:hypothetical protein